MALSMNLKYTSQLDTLIRRFPCFAKLKNQQIWEYEESDLKKFFDGQIKRVDRRNTYRWKVPSLPFFDHKAEISALPVMFIGKTGYGKSTLLNYIIGHTVFPVDDIMPCTSEIDAAFFRLGADPMYYLCLCDLPGVGESMQADQKYIKWYTELVQYSPSVVYVLRADQRDFSVDERAMNHLFPTQDARDKVVVALNYADKLGATSRESEGVSELEDALEKKVEIVADHFSIDSYRIFPCCAHNGYGVEDLLGEVTDDLSLCVYEAE